MQLTKEEIARVFAMYLGCECKWRQHTYKVNSAKFVTGINDILPFNETKLLLTPLEKISDEHAIEVARFKKKNIFQENDYDRPRTKHGMKDLGNGICISKNMCWEGYQYLISKGYSVPLFFGLNHWANSKTPIELNIGIEKTSMKPQEIVAQFEPAIPHHGETSLYTYEQMIEAVKNSYGRGVLDLQTHLDASMFEFWEKLF